MAKKTTIKQEKVESKKPSIKNIDEALFAFQSENISIPRSSTGIVNGRTYKYANLDDTINITRPVLQKYGIMLTQIPLDGVLITTLKHVESGTIIESKISIGDPASSQDLGARITYLRRYSLSAMLGLSLEEDTDASNKDLKAPVTVETKAVPTPVKKAVERPKNTPHEVGSNVSFASEISVALSKANSAVDSCKTSMALDEIVKAVENSTKLTETEKELLRIRMDNKRTDLIVALG